jgi:hypothetical protein
MSKIKRSKDNEDERAYAYTCVSVSVHTHAYAHARKRVKEKALSILEKTRTIAVRGDLIFLTRVLQSIYIELWFCLLDYLCSVMSLADSHLQSLRTHLFIRFTRRDIYRERERESE